MVSISGGQSIRWSFLRIHKGLLFVYQSAINASNLFLFSLKQIFVAKTHVFVCIFSLAYYSKQKNTIQTYSVESRKNVTRKQGGRGGGRGGECFASFPSFFVNVLIDFGIIQPFVTERKTFFYAATIILANTKHKVYAIFS